ncbi:fibronectin type III domain-containing protein [Nocardiopsis salina]|uniref:fibronectin type III domain-containing protein n=1 Tax=Nocardiopsis salina TaxID=245836 RepID=UPI000347C2FA|nr:fibronectin type III domain-containing protein [Nocardiopsis salina]
MSWDARERRRYEDEVLAPARLEGPPADLFVRYGIGPALEQQLRTDPEAFSEHVERVCTHWRGLRLRRRALKKVLVDLVAAHDRLHRCGHLTHDHFASVREQDRQRAAREWAEIAGSLTTSLLERAELRGMIRSVGIDESRAEQVLADRGVHVVEDLPRLPVRAPVPTFRTLQENLRTCGAAFSPALVFGPRRLERGFTVLDGFRLADGAGLGEEALAEARAGLGAEALTDGKAAAENVLSILRADGDRDVREAVVLWEVVCDLRARPIALSESGLVRPWVRLGLDEREARLLAAAVRRTGPGPDLGARAEDEVRALLADHLLRRAQRAAVDLPEGHALHRVLAERAGQVDDLVRGAEQALRGDRPEEAARALASAVEVAADDTVLAGRLAEIAPAAPRSVAVRMEGSRAVVAWQPSPSLAGGVRYRVERVTGRGTAERGAVVGEVAGTELVDTELPVGTDVRYAVVAVRGGRASSHPVVCEPVMLAPDVADLRLRAGRYAVTASWRVPEEAVRVEVLRRCGAPPRNAGDGVGVPTDGTGFQDHAVEPGVEYFYRIRAVYLTSAGRTRSSAGLVLRAEPGPGPLPVSDLAVAYREEGTVVSWPSSSARGRVALWVGRREPAWEAGARLSGQDLAAFGDEVVEPPGPVEGGRTGVRVPVLAGRSHVLAVTVDGEQRLAGAHRRITRVPRVEDLQAQRSGAQVRLSWTWPEHASSALVEWRPVDSGGISGGRCEGADEGRGPGGGHVGEVHGEAASDVWLRRCDDPRNGNDGGLEDSSGRMFCARCPDESEGGFEAPMGPGPVEVSVRTVMPACPGEAMSAPVRAGVPGAVVVAYRVEAVGWWRRDRAVHLTAETSGTVPEIAVVHAPERVQPHSVAQGQVLATFSAGVRRAGEHTQVRVRPPPGAEPGRLVCFPVPDLEGPTRAHPRRPSERELRL